MKYKFFLILLFCYLSVFSQKEVFVLKDTTNNFTLAKVQNMDFKILDKELLEGYTKSSYWFKIPVHSTDSEYIVRFQYDRIQYAEAFQGAEKIKQLSNQRFVSFQITRDKDVFIKVIPDFHAYLPVKLDTLENSIFKENNQLLINGFYYGFAFLVFIYNLLYYFIFKDNTFLYYALFLCSMTFGIFTMDGMLNYFGIFGFSNNFLMIINYIFLAYFSSKFANNYLFIDEYFPKLKKFSYSLGVIIIILGIAFLVNTSFYYLFALNVLVFSLLFVYWFLGIFLFKKNIYTKILVFGYVIILFSAIDFYIFKFLGVPIININPLTIKIGAFLEMIILSIAVVYRMNILKEENKFMKNEIIQYSKKLDVFSQDKIEEKTPNLKDLSVRERQIFDLIVKGNTNKEVASHLNVSVNTVKFHIKNIYEKLSIKSRKEAQSLEIVTNN